jgi:hypothetical protein
MTYTLSTIFQGIDKRVPLFAEQELLGMELYLVLRFVCLNMENFV